MKKILLMVVLLLCLFNSKVYAEEGWSEWSVEQENVEGEESAVQYGYQRAKTWSEWSRVKFESFYQKEQTVNEKLIVDGLHLPMTWDDVEEKTVYETTFPQEVYFSKVFVDIDCYRSPQYDNYIGPPLRLYVDGKEVARTDKHNELENWTAYLNVYGCEVKLKMKDASNGKRNVTYLLYVHLYTLVKEYAEVIEWHEGEGWRFEEVYEAEYDKKSAERIVYRHPLVYQINYELNGGYFKSDVKDTYTILDEYNLPEADKKGYIFEGWSLSEDSNAQIIERINKGSFGDLTLYARWKRKKPSLAVGLTYFMQDEVVSIDDLLKVASASDELDGDLSHKITINKIIYEKTGYEDNDPHYLDTSIVQSVIVYYQIVNSGGMKTQLSRRFHILPLGEEVVNDEEMIYSRFISEEYLSTLDDNSIWVNDEEYIKALSGALERMKGA